LTIPVLPPGFLITMPLKQGISDPRNFERENEFISKINLIE